MPDSGYYYNTTEYKENVKIVQEQKEQLEREAAARAIEKQKLVKKETSKLRRIFSVERCGKENEHNIQKLIDRAAWLSVELAYMEQDLQTEGMTQLFTQGLQMIVRENPLAKVYDRSVKSYREILTKLESYVIPEKVPEVEASQNPISDILARGNAARKKYAK